jgi:hypothetical protein
MNCINCINCIILFSWSKGLAPVSNGLPVLDFSSKKQKINRNQSNSGKKWRGTSHISQNVIIEGGPYTIFQIHAQPPQSCEAPEVPLGASRPALAPLGDSGSPQSPAALEGLRWPCTVPLSSLRYCRIRIPTVPNSLLQTHSWPLICFWLVPQLPPSPQSASTPIGPWLAPDLLLIGPLICPPSAPGLLPYPLIWYDLPSIDH